MSEGLSIEIKNATHAFVWSDDDNVRYRLSEAFAFKIAKAHFHPKVKAGMWDGFIRLYSMYSGQVYTGLVPKIRKWANENNIPVKFSRSQNGNETSESIQDWLENDLKATDETGQPLEIRPYQVEAIKRAVNHRRLMIRSATASGKSFVIYAILCNLAAKDAIQDKVLIIVPTIALVTQIKGDFADYAQNDPDFNADELIHTIAEGAEKNTDKPIVISTWQAIQDMPGEWFHQFDTVFGDEAHGFEAKKLQHIMENCVNAHTRIGLTGTLRDDVIHTLTITGLFGPVYTAILTHEMIEQGYSANLKITSILFEYSDEERQAMAQAIKILEQTEDGKTRENKEGKYSRELSYIVDHEKRNNFIKNLAIKSKGNTLILFERVEGHGEILYSMIQQAVGESRPVYFVSGKIKGKDREAFRKQIENDDNAILIASYGTFSTGINIKRLHNLILASPTKSVIRLLQSIGRALRKGRDKTTANLYDLGDNFCRKKYKNYTYEHFVERLRIYQNEKLDYRIKRIDL